MSKLDEVLSKYPTNGLLPCAMGAVVTRDKGVVYTGAHGYKDITDEESIINLDSALAFFSCTKAIATTALLQLLERGLIDSIDDPVDKYVKEMDDIQIIEGFDENDKPILKKAVNKATIRHLMTHTAGFSYTFFSHAYMKLYETTKSPDILKSEWSEFQSPLLFEPGTKWHYGVNIDWIGKIVENVSGESLDHYCKKNIFEPLGAKSLTFHKTTEQYDNSITIHQREPSGNMYPLGDVFPKEIHFEAGGHGMFGTLSDYIKFLEIFLHEGKSPNTGKQILKPETVKNYSLTNLLPENVHIESTLEYSQPPFANKVSFFDNYPKDKQGWTSSFHQIDEDVGTGRSKGSYNWAGLANSYYWIDVNKGISGIFSSQLFPFNDDTAIQAFREFETEAYKIFT